jgi:hypothetical protein
LGCDGVCGGPREEVVEGASHGDGWMDGCRLGCGSPRDGTSSSTTHLFSEEMNFMEAEMWWVVPWGHYGHINSHIMSLMPGAV